MEHCLPGTVVVANDPAATKVPTSPGTSLKFEPVSFDDEEGLRTLWEADLSLWLDELEKAGSLPVPTSTTFSAWRLVGGIVLAIVIACLSMGFLSWLWFRDSWAKGAFMLLILVAVTAIPYIWLNFSERQWWVVPGGFLYRDYRAWRNRFRTGHIRAAESVLLMDFRAERILLVSKGSLFDVSVEDSDLSGILSGWLSRAQPPSEEEVRAFLDPEGIGRNQS
jgi:hypothetical protein